MIDHTIVNTRIARIRKLLSRLQIIISINESDFEQDLDSQLITERSLQIIAQSMLDIGNHLIAHHGWGKPESYRQVMTILVQQNIIPQKYKTELEGLASLRNILVHDYLAIDPKILYQDLRRGMEAIKIFIMKIETKFGTPPSDEITNE